MESKILLDPPKKRAIESFLNYIYDLKKSNSDLSIDKDFVYNELCRYGLKKEDMFEDRSLRNNNYLFGRWFDTFYPVKNINAYCNPNWSYFFQFVNGNLRNDNEFIKLYIPIDSKHLEESVNRLFKYIASLNIEHCSKVSQEVRSDNVVVRLKKGDYYNAMKIINFVNSDEYIKKSLNKTNPFVPTLNGIGIMEENGISYNGEIANHVAHFINRSYREHKESVSYDEFNYFMEKNNYDKDVQNALHGKLGDIKEELSSHQKLNLFLDSLTATYQKYGLTQAVGALKEAMHGNFSCFTNSSPNKVKYRSLMNQNLEMDDIKIFVRSALEQVLGDISSLSTDEMSVKYCNYLLQDDLVRKLDAASKNTIANYDSSQLTHAIQKYIFNGDTSSFSKYKKMDGKYDESINYRDYISSIGQNSIMEVIKKSLIIRGLNINALSDRFLIEMYSHELEKGMYYGESEMSNSPVK
jgi:hypothetical protein